MADHHTSSPPLARIADAGAIQEAAQLLLAGDLVAFPTETVYGLGADARSDAAVAKIFAAKGRPAGNPVIVHTHDTAAARACTANWPASAEELAAKFWPGPLTLILPRGPSISPAVSAGRDTVALRVPNHPIAQQLLRAFNAPIAAPSANRSGFTSPTSAQHVLAELNGRIPLILDGGECAIGIESTVLDLSAAIPTILRPGAITLEMLRPFVGEIQTARHIVAPEDSALSPGQHSRHYAPQKPAYLITKSALNTFGPGGLFYYSQVLEARYGQVVFITHDRTFSLPPPHEVILLPADPTSYAHHLYASLRQADTMNVSTILLFMPDDTDGLWAAIQDRLLRAAQPLPFP